MNSIAALNRKLAESLGRVRAGAEARFSWQYAPDLPFWRDRLGKVWVLCQWQPPRMSRAEWTQHFGDRFAYPSNGLLHAHPETALAPGRLPDERLTQNYIWALDRQLSTSFVQQFCDVQNELADQRDRDYVQWVDLVQNSNPAFSHFEPGKRGHHVSYGGFPQ